MNGLPEPGLDAIDDRTYADIDAEPADTRPGERDRTTFLFACGAVAAIAVPTIIAVRTLLRRGRPRAYDARVLEARQPSADTEATPPHGDKLLPRGL